MLSFGRGGLATCCRHEASSLNPCGRQSLQGKNSPKHQVLPGVMGRAPMGSSPSLSLARLLAKRPQARLVLVPFGLLVCAFLRAGGGLLAYASVQQTCHMLAGPGPPVMFAAVRVPGTGEEVREARRFGECVLGFGGICMYIYICTYLCMYRDDLDQVLAGFCRFP